MNLINDYLYWLFETYLKEQKMYIIKLGNKRFNNKSFTSYEAARKYVRKAITKRLGKYQDSIGEAGFTIVAK